MDKTSIRNTMPDHKLMLQKCSQMRSFFFLW